MDMKFPMIYLGFSGRINRKRFLTYFLLLFFQALIIDAMLFSLLMNVSHGFFIANVVGIGWPIYFLSVLMVKRFHDINQRGMFVLPLCIIVYIVGLFYSFFSVFKPLYYIYLIFGMVQFIVVLILLFSKGTEGKNKYGIDPLKKEKKQKKIGI